MGSVWKDTRKRSDRRDRWVAGFNDVNGRQTQVILCVSREREAYRALALMEDDVQEAISKGLPSRKALVSQRKTRSMTLSAFVEAEYLPAMSPPMRRPDTHKRDIGLFANVRALLGKLPLAAIDITVIERYFSKRKHQKTRRGRCPSPAQLNRERQFLSSVLGMARRRRLIRENPISDIKRLREDNCRDKVISPKEESLILKVAPLFLQYILVFLINTGMRVSEALRLKWESVDLKRGWIYVGDDSKGHQRRQVPINKAVAGILASVMPVFSKEPDSPFVFVNPRTRNPYRRYSVLNALKAAAARVGVFGIVTHTTRHTFASRMLEAGVPREKVKLIGGWKTDSMLDRYKHLEPDSVQGLTEVLSDFGKKTKKEAR